jgi:hypothetical protein
MGNIHKSISFFSYFRTCAFTHSKNLTGSKVRGRNAIMEENTKELYWFPVFFSLSSSFHTIDATGIWLDIEHRGHIDGIHSPHTQNPPVPFNEVNHTEPDRVGAVGRTRRKHAVPG